MNDFPVKYFGDNLIFNKANKECWAIYKMVGFNYDYKSDESKIGILNRLSRFISQLGREAKILIIPVPQDVDMHYDNLTKNLDKDDELYEYTKAHANGACEYLKKKLEKKGSANDYVVYVLTKLKIQNRLTQDLKEACEYFISSPVRSIEESLGLRTKEIFESELEKFKMLANEYLESQSKRIVLIDANENDTQWLIKRMNFRGLGEVKIKKNFFHNGGKQKSIRKYKKAYDETIWTPFSERIIKNGQVVVRALEVDILNLLEGEIDVSEGRKLMVHHADGRTSHQAFLAVTHIPDGIVFPGNEYLLHLQDLPMQTEVCISIDVLEYKESQDKIDNQKRDIEGQISHIEDSNDEVPDELLQSKEYADELKNELKAAHVAITRTSITFCVADETAVGLESKANFIKELYEDYNFMIERPIADQLKLYMEFIPGAGRYMNDYIQPLPPKTLAGGMIGATRLLGDNVGPYIGTTGKLEKNVYLDVLRACLLNRSASAAFLGTLGGGKSFNANLLLYLTIMYGGRGLVFDPKGERSNWINDLPELKDSISITTLSADEEDRGKLDPFLIYADDMNKAGYLALSILAEVFELSSKDEEYIAILETVEWVKNQESPCMIKLAEKLLKFPEEDELSKPARMVGRKIKLLRNMAMAGLLFGTGKEKGLSFNNRLNILQIQNLDMPDPETKKDDYTMEERLSTVLMLPMASFARSFMHSDRSVPKVVLFDEAWALSSNKPGIKMMNSLIREGRALYAGCFFIGHSVKDMKIEGIKNNISYKFCFKATDNDEIIRILDFLDLEATEENINEIKNLGNGQCLFQDLDKRVGKLKFDAVFGHLKKAFDTTPNKKKKKEGAQHEAAS